MSFVFLCLCDYRYRVHSSLPSRNSDLPHEVSRYEGGIMAAACSMTSSQACLRCCLQKHRHTHTHTQTHRHTHTHKHRHTHTQVYLYIYIYIYTHTHTHQRCCLHLLHQRRAESPLHLPVVPIVPESPTALAAHSANEKFKPTKSDTQNKAGWRQHPSSKTSMPLQDVQSSILFSGRCLCCCGDFVGL